MGKANDKKVIREAADLVAVAMGNLLESERERKYAHKTKPGPKRRRTFCNKFGLSESSVAWIETGRFLQLKFDQLRPYLAALRGQDDKKLLGSFRKVYDGLKEVDVLLKQL